MNIVGDAKEIPGPMLSNALEPQTVTITDKRELYKCYMSNIKGGGLFVPFQDEAFANKIQPGQKIFILFSMLEQKTKTPIQGKVVWINRDGQNKGYGIAFGDSTPMKALKDLIETTIADIAVKKEPTYTF